MIRYVYVILVLIYFTNCVAKSDGNSWIQDLKIKKALSGKRLLLINWDHCSSCRAYYTEMVTRYLEVGDIDIFIISNQRKKIGTLINHEQLYYISSQELLALEVYVSLPQLISKDQDGHWMITELEPTDFADENAITE
ncbi:hypothetical protein [Rhodonellum sp.]|uniref:hypothetical protein n=1 Tax=Rhodonellum sp. TaxID=2231180 RepID=UPI00271CCA6E|nr:hypothetical protein [Rhodonellum sp.]MDO9551285.1 hypothetical protein [Rhodonellum sp.]